MTHPGAYLYATQQAPLGDRISTLLNDSAATPVDFRVNTILVPNSVSPEGGAEIADVYRSLPYLDYDTVISIAPSRGEQFKRITVYLKWIRPTAFVSGIATNITDSDTRLRAVNVGGQIDLRIMMFSYLKTTLSAGWARAKLIDGRSSTETMISLKIL